MLGLATLGVAGAGLWTVVVMEPSYNARLAAAAHSSSPLKNEVAIKEDLQGWKTVNSIRSMMFLFSFVCGVLAL